MIARPLELASRLRQPPRSFDSLFYVNVGMLGLFFCVFGSRFVLAPGLGVDFRLPELPGSLAAATPASCYLTVLRSGQIFTEDGIVTLPELREWLKQRAKTDRNASLLIRASAGATLSELADIQGAAHDAGFQKVTWAAEDPRPASP